MKLVTRILNLIMCVILFCTTTLVEFGLYNIVALPAGHTSVISVVEKDEDENGYADNLTYFDTFKFVADDLHNSITREPRFVIRSWFKWDWWQTGMRWADVALEFTVGTVVPVVAPIYEVKEIQYYYTEEYPVTAVLGDGEYIVSGLYKLKENELNKITVTSPDYDPSFVENFKQEHGTQFAYAEFTNPVIVDGVSSTITTGGSIYRIADGKVEEVTYWVRYGNSENFVSNEWKKENRTFINVLMKLNKYNGIDDEGRSIYTKWVYKFMETDNNNTIKASACSLYFQFYLAILLSLWFCYQNPIVITRNGYGEDEVSGGLRHKSVFNKEKKEKHKHRGLFKFGKKNKHKREDKE